MSHWEVPPDHSHEWNMRILFSAFAPKKISYTATLWLYVGLLSFKTFTCRTSAFQQIFVGPTGLEIAMGHPSLQHRILLWGYIIAYSLTSELGKRTFSPLPEAQSKHLTHRSTSSTSPRKEETNPSICSKCHPKLEDKKVQSLCYMNFNRLVMFKLTRTKDILLPSCSLWITWAVPGIVLLKQLPITELTYW